MNLTNELLRDKCCGIIGQTYTSIGFADYKEIWGIISLEAQTLLVGRAKQEAEMVDTTDECRFHFSSQEAHRANCALQR